MFLGAFLTGNQTDSLYVPIISKNGKVIANYGGFEYPVTSITRHEVVIDNDINLNVLGWFKLPIQSIVIMKRLIKDNLPNENIYPRFSTPSYTIEQYQVESAFDYKYIYTADSVSKIIYKVDTYASEGLDQWEYCSTKEYYKIYGKVVNS